MRGLVGDHKVAAVRAALEPFAWPRLTPDMLARCLLAALDSHRVDSLLASVPGASPGDASPLRPADRGDVRVDVLVDFLACHRWQGLTLSALCRQLLDVLADSYVERACFSIELRHLSGGE